MVQNTRSGGQLEVFVICACVCLIKDSESAEDGLVCLSGSSSKSHLTSILTHQFDL